MKWRKIDTSSFSETSPVSIIKVTSRGLGGRRLILWEESTQNRSRLKWKKSSAFTVLEWTTRKDVIPTPCIGFEVVSLCKRVLIPRVGPCDNRRLSSPLFQRPHCRRYGRHKCLILDVIHNLSFLNYIVHTLTMGIFPDGYFSLEPTIDPCV